MSSIPVYQIKAPEYKVEESRHLSGKLHHTSFGTPVPIEYWENRPDFDLVSSRIVTCLREHFGGQKILLRLLGSVEHPDKSIDELIEIVKKTGHDRYNPERTGDRYENIENREIEIFALKIEVGKEKGEDGEKQIRHALESFYTYPIKERGKPIKIDIGIVYKPNQLEPVAHRYEGREDETKTDGYIFKEPNSKSDAILAILKII